MYHEKMAGSNFISGNKHLFHSDFVRSFISSVGILKYLGDNRPSPIEFSTPNYIPTTDSIPWRPWHHIYSMCKGGKGQKHNPQVNEMGKYVVRLFWMGCWRKITVDDLIPIGYCEQILLPLLEERSTAEIPLHSHIIPEGKSTITPSSKTGSAKDNPENIRKEIEIWPFILCKALVKLSNLSQTDENEIVDFDIIHCLTGWFLYKIEVASMGVADVWNMCAGYTDHYSWPDRLQTDCKASSHHFLADESGGMALHLVGVCSDMRITMEGSVPDISPCWSHSFLIDQTRNIPLIKPTPLPELERWKRFRWLAWAVRKGIWSQPDVTPIKCIKIVSDFKKCADRIVCQESIDIMNSVGIIEELALQMGDRKQGNKSGLPDTDHQGDHTEPGSSIWIDFNKFGPYISYLFVYFKLSHFKNVTKVTDIIQSAEDVGKGKVDKGKKGKATEAPPFKFLTWNNNILLSRNEPVYLFADSLDFKLIVLNFAQIGNVNALRPRTNTENTSHDSNMLFEMEPALVNTTPFSCVIIEEFNWQTPKHGEAVVSLSTYGNKSLLLDVRPGRFVYRMWIKSDVSYIIHLMSDSEVICGTLETILEYMSHESERIIQMSDHISSAFGQLVQKFGIPTYIEQLRLFYKSYLHDAELPKRELVILHRSFMDEFVNAVKQSTPKAEIRERVFALKVLFLNPQLDAYTLSGVSPKTTPISCIADTTSDNSLSINREKIKQRAAVTLQAYFKQIYISKLKHLHAQSHKNHLKIFDNLKQIYTDTFSTAKRMTTCSNLIRHFLFPNNEMIDISSHFSIINDLNCTIHLQQFVGSLNTTMNSWIAITRYTFYCNSANNIIVQICLFCGLPKFMVRVFDNDTNKEINRFTNNVLVNAYSSNATGYTVLCYGWSDIEREYAWKLDFVSLKLQTTSLLIIPQVNIYNNILKQNYVPNAKNCICRCIIKIKNDVLISFRLSTNYDNVNLHFRCLNEVGQVFGEITGRQNVILPSVALQYILLVDDTADQSALPSSTQISSKESKLARSRSKLDPSTTLTRASKRSLKSFEKLSVDKRSYKDFTLRSSSPELSMIEEIKYKDTVYIVEAFVLNDSWPLTKHEWDVTEEIKTRKLLTPINLEQSTTQSVISSTRKMRVRSTASSRRSLEKSVSAMLTPLSPYWTLQIISNSDDKVIAQVDQRRQEKINEIKRKWYEADTERYQRSKQLREEYLESHYIQLENETQSWDSPHADSKAESFSKQSSIDSTHGIRSKSDGMYKSRSNSVRTLDYPRTFTKPVPEDKILPSLNLDDYLKQQDKAEEVVTYVKTEEHEEKLRVMRVNSMINFEKNLERYKGDMNKFLQEEMGKFKFLQEFYTSFRKESIQMMSAAYHMREKVIDIIIAKHEHPV